MIYDLDVEGVMMGSRMTKSQVIAKFGDNIANFPCWLQKQMGKANIPYGAMKIFLWLLMLMKMI